MSNQWLMERSNTYSIVMDETWTPSDCLTVCEWEHGPCIEFKDV